MHTSERWPDHFDSEWRERKPAVGELRPYGQEVRSYGGQLPPYGREVKPFGELERDGEREGPQRRRGLGPLWEVLLLVTAFVVALGTFHSAPAEPPQPAAGQGTRTSGQAAAAPLPASDPLRVIIPTVGVDAPLTGLELEKGGRLAAPPDTDANLAGWWVDGPVPGTRGTAIIAGHVDIPGGPAVFYRLGALEPGGIVEVARADERTARFAVDSVDVYDAEDFPDDKVYADTGRAELRLITCGGGYDEKAGHYRGNVVVTAHLTD